MECEEWSVEFWRKIARCFSLCNYYLFFVLYSLLFKFFHSKNIPPFILAKTERHGAPKPGTPYGRFFGFGIFLNPKKYINKFKGKPLGGFLSAIFYSPFSIFHSKKSVDRKRLQHKASGRFFNFCQTMRTPPRNKPCLFPLLKNPVGHDQRERAAPISFICLYFVYPKNPQTIANAQKPFLRSTDFWLDF